MNAGKLTADSRTRLYTLIAGINGAGKTSLYNVFRDDGNLGKRVNIDEIVAAQGDWHDTLLQIKSGRIALEMINFYIENGISFHQETTLPGSTIIKQMKKAKENGFRIRLYFVGVDDINTAIERVHRRVEMGGHGVDDRFILKRYEQLVTNLRRVLPLCDTAILYDNTVRFRQIAVIIDGKMVDCDRDLPKWFIELLDYLPG